MRLQTHTAEDNNTHTHMMLVTQNWYRSEDNQEVEAKTHSQLSRTHRPCKWCFHRHHQL